MEDQLWVRRLNLMDLLEYADKGPEHEQLVGLELLRRKRAKLQKREAAAKRGR